MNYHFRYHLTEDDFGEFQAYTCWQAPWQKSFRIKHLLRLFIASSIAMVVTLLLFNQLYPSKGDKTLTYAICALLVPVITLTSYNGTPSRFKKRARKLLEKPENSSLLSEKELEISENGFIHSNSETRMDQKWSSIIKYAATKDYFYLYINSMQGHVIPKRLFASGKEIEEFDKFLTEKIPLSSTFRAMGI
jgi:hypothetical protein